MNIAAIQFFQDNTFALHIAPPVGFVVSDQNGIINALFNSYFITWVSDYRLTHNGNEIWKLTNQKQQAVSKLNLAQITIVQ